MGPWLRFFRVVNLPTVPGDVLVGAAAVIWGSLDYNTTAVCASVKAIVAACFTSIFLYLFGLADNDIVGAKKDGSGIPRAKRAAKQALCGVRPIPAGEISLGAARIARGICLFAVMIAGASANLPPFWWIAAFLLAVVIVIYNRTKWCFAMGLCRGLNVVCGGVAILTGFSGLTGLCVTGILWIAYITFVTKYSEGEDADPAKRRRVGFLIGALVYLQLGALLFFYLQSPCLALRNLLLVGAGLLILLRLMKRIFPRVSAS